MPGGNVLFAIAAVVPATAPAFVLILFFWHRIVSGLTAGAVKGRGSRFHLASNTLGVRG